MTELKIRIWYMTELKISGLVYNGAENNRIWYTIELKISGLVYNRA